MAIYRCSYIFNAGFQGWSEQWYIDGGSQSPIQIAQFLSNPVALQGFLAPRALGVYLRALRVNDVAKQRSTFLNLLNLNAGLNNPVFKGDGEEPNVAVLGYLQSFQGFRRSVMIRGLIDAEVVRDDNDVWQPSGNITAALALWFQYITKSGLGIYYLQPETFGNADRQVVSFGANPNDAGLTRVTYSGDVMDPEGTVIFHKVPRKTFPGYSGPLPYINGTSATFDVPVRWAQPTTPIQMRTATCRNAIFLFDPAVKFTPEDIRTKKCGRPTLLSRGRRAGVSYRSR